MSTVNPDSVAQDQIRSFFERWERLEGEKDAISGDLRELFAEAKGDGFDTKVLRKLFRDQAADANERAEFESLYDLYAAALNGPRVRDARDAREDQPDHDPETGEIIETTVPRHGAGEASGAVSVADAAPLAEIPAAILSAQPNGVNPETTTGSAVVGETERVYPGGENANSVGKADASHASLNSPADAEGSRSARGTDVGISGEASDESGATPALVATNSGQPSPENDRSRGATSSLNSTPAPVDRSKPNPWCMDPDECGVEASWDYFCLKCQAVKKGREAAGAALQ